MFVSYFQVISWFAKIRNMLRAASSNKVNLIVHSNVMRTIHQIHSLLGRYKTNQLYTEIRIKW